MVQAMFGDGIPRRRPALAVMLIFVGTTVASSAEMHLNMVGVLVMLASVYFEAVRLILTQRLLSKHKVRVRHPTRYARDAPSRCADGTHHAEGPRLPCMAAARDRGLVLHLPHLAWLGGRRIGIP